MYGQQGIGETDMRVIAIANQKGGSGKTTTTVNLAAALGEQGRRVLVIDFDPQAAATAWYDGDGTSEAPYEVLRKGEPIAGYVAETATPGVALVPSSDWLTTAEQELPGAIGGQMALRRAVAEIPAGAYDYVLIDCSPSLGALVVNALTAAREILVPVAAQIATLKGLSDLMRTVQEIKRAGLNPDLRIAGYLPCRVDARAKHPGEVVALLRETFGGDVLATQIRENTRLAEAVGFQQPITTYDTRSAGAEDYRALALEIISQEREDSNGKE